MVCTAELPCHGGNYGVGTIDVELPIKPPLKINDTRYTSSGRLAFQIDTTLFTLFYLSTKNA